MSRVVTRSRTIEFSERLYEEMVIRYEKARRRRRGFHVRETNSGRRIYVLPHTVLRIEE